VKGLAFLKNQIDVLKFRSKHYLGENFKPKNKHMSANLLDSLTGVFTKELIGKAASSLGESESSVSKAVTASIPALLSSFMSSSSSDGGSNLLNIAKQAASSGVLDNLGGLFSSGSSNTNMGANLLTSLLGGNKLGGLTSLISGFSGMKQNNVSSLLGSIAPIALGFLGKHAISNNLSAGGILSWLTSQKSQISAAVPSGLNLSSVFDGASSVVNSAANEAGKAANNWLMPLLLGLLALGLGWYFMKGCNKGADVVAPVVDSASQTVNNAVDTAKKVVTEAFENMKVKLAGGLELDAHKGGIEDKLVTFINDPATKGGKDVWFDFDNINFELGSAKLTAESQAQINNIAAIMKAYPKAMIKIGGYTDKTGDSLANIKLSNDRAVAVDAAIKAAGVDAARLAKPEGYGSQFAVVPAAASDEERKKDRRIAVGVREK
jgi:outer membrane protein OmpA-like peptidoglycan-associated protein